MSVYLRFQLPPLHLANVECVEEEMHLLMGVRGDNARKIIKDLDVQSTPLACSCCLLLCHSPRTDSGLVIS